ncbi:MAG: zinc-finger protein [Alphaproteobacteria bacterium]|nr:MAG: zinc-finger protein [Alphaproteobacteria bacterium]
MSQARERAPLARTMWRGARLRCPSCGRRTLFRAYLKLNPRCPSCGADFSHSETADVAPYVTVMLMGLVVMPSTLVLVLNTGVDAELMLVPSLLFAVLAALSLLPRVKGVLAALLWRARREM